ncbi:Protein of unknown function [Thermobacillus xylanilyticus]|jgi:hypothetical protein
MEEE